MTFMTQSVLDGVMRRWQSVATGDEGDGGPPARPSWHSVCLRARGGGGGGLTTPGYSNNGFGERRQEPWPWHGMLCHGNGMVGREMQPHGMGWYGMRCVRSDKRASCTPLPTANSLVGRVAYLAAPACLHHACRLPLPRRRPGPRALQEGGRDGHERWMMSDESHHHHRQ